MKTIELHAPTSWNELNPEQVVFVAKVLSLKPSAEELLVQCFLKFTGLKIVVQPHYKNARTERRVYPLGTDDAVEAPKTFKYKGTKIALTAAQIHSFCQQLNFLTEVPGNMVCPNIDGFRSPDSELWTTTFEEYLMADQYYRAYSKSQDESFLLNLAAVLWRYKEASYSDDIIEKNARKIKRKTNHHERQAVFLWWTGKKLWLKNKYPELFTPAGESEETIDEADMVMNMLNSITGGRAHENKQVFKTPVHEVLHSLNAKAKEAAEITAKMNKK